MVTATICREPSSSSSEAVSRSFSRLPEWLHHGEIPSLNGIRAIAVLLVVLAHAYQTAGFPQLKILGWIANRGSIGVEIFFVLSGFLITLLLLRERLHTGRIGIKDFYLRRLLRIVPAYMVFLSVVAILQVVGSAKLARLDWLAAITYTVNFLRHPPWEIGHAWSLSIEEHFYLLWPLVIALLPRRVGPFVALSAISIGFFGRWAVLVFFPAYTPMAELWTFTRIDSIAVGCLLAFAAWEDGLRLRLNACCSPQWAPLVVVACLAISMANTSAKWSVGFAYSVNSICIAILIWMAVCARLPQVNRLLNHRSMRSIGIMSYSLYLWQQLFLHRGNDYFACSFPQNIFFAIFAAGTSYYVVERPFLMLKNRLGDALKTKHVERTCPVQA